jgi:hypothetical protein
VTSVCSTGRSDLGLCTCATEPYGILHTPWNLVDEGDTFLWNVGSHLPRNTASYPRRPEFSSTPLWKTQNSHKFEKFLPVKIPQAYRITIINCLPFFCLANNGRHIRILWQVFKYRKETSS